MLVGSGVDFPTFTRLRVPPSGGCGPYPECSFCQHARQDLAGGNGKTSRGFVWN